MSCLLATAHGVPLFFCWHLATVGCVCFAVNFYFYLFHAIALCVWVSVSSWNSKSSQFWIKPKHIRHFCFRSLLMATITHYIVLKSIFGVGKFSMKQQQNSWNYRSMDMNVCRLSFVVCRWLIVDCRFSIVEYYDADELKMCRLWYVSNFRVFDATGKHTIPFVRFPFSKGSLKILYEQIHRK